MPIIELHDATSGASAKILPEVGFNCFELKVPVAGRVIDVLSTEPGFEEGGQRASGSGIPILFPFPNRIRGAQFVWDGHEYHLPTKPGRHEAIHGFVLDHPWRSSQPDSATAIGQFQLSKDSADRAHLWPADFLLEVQYALRGTVLRADILIKNVDTKPLPWGFGTHPYFHAALSSDSDPADTLVKVPCAKAWTLIDCLPTGEQTAVDDRTDLRTGVSLAGRVLDDVLTDVATEDSHIETYVMDPTAGVQITQLTDAIFREWVVYTPPGRPSVCLEPYTCVTDAVNLQHEGLETGWHVLEPGGEIRTWIEIGVGPIYA